jgi:hypothetical protein
MRFSSGKMKYLSTASSVINQPSPMLPVAPVLADLSAPVLTIVLYPEETRDGSLHWVTDIIDIERVAVRPAVEAAY